MCAISISSHTRHTVAFRLLSEFRIRRELELVINVYIYIHISYCWRV